MNVPAYILAASYLCLGCGNRWVQRAGPVTCQVCGCFIVKWTNHPLVVGSDDAEPVKKDER